MENLDAVAISSMLTIVGSGAVLVALGLKARKNIFGSALTDSEDLGGGDGQA